MDWLWTVRWGYGWGVSQGKYQSYNIWKSIKREEGYKQKSRNYLGITATKYKNRPAKANGYQRIICFRFNAMYENTRGQQYLIGNNRFLTQVLKWEVQSTLIFVRKAYICISNCPSMKRMNKNNNGRRKRHLNLMSIYQSMCCILTPIKLYIIF